jgi:hypothetical protein
VAHRHAGITPKVYRISVRCFTQDFGNGVEPWEHRMSTQRIKLTRLSMDDAIIYDERVGIIKEIQYRAADTVDYLNLVKRMHAKQGAVTAVFLALPLEDQYAHDELDAFARARRIKLINQLELQ